MRFFVCLVDSQDRGISDVARQMYEALSRSRGLEFAWQDFDHAALLTAWDDPYGDPLVARSGDHVAVGVVRLDNRKEIERWAGGQGRGFTDLELVLHTVIRHGAKYIPMILGDFAFVVWNGLTRTAVAVTDALGVKRLYYTERDGITAFASRAEALAVQERYEVQYLAELISQCIPSPGLTVYSGVRRVPAGTMAALQGRELTLRSYWSPDEFIPEPFKPKSEHEAPKKCRSLLAESVRHRVCANGGTWAQLSGGLDSSSIVSMTQWLAERGEIPQGLAGTVTFVDWQGTDADEREYSDAVVEHWHVRNETIVDPAFWLDERAAPPHLDQPNDSLAFYPRERRLCAIVRGAGGRVLLAGFGSDEVFTGSTLFFADWLAQGRVWSAMREMTRWAAIGRISLWQLAYENALLPLVPAALRRPKSFNQGRLLPWISATAARRYGLGARTSTVAGNDGRLGRKYHDLILRGVTAITTSLDAAGIGDSLDVRYPFLYRPLVEFALRLPPALCARPQARKWVLREAMRGILPDIVRTRVGKGAPTDALVGSLTAQRSLLEPLVCDSILGHLGIVDDVQLRAAFHAAPLGGYGDRDLCADVQMTLMVEAWLRIQSGRWPQGSSKYRSTKVVVSQDVC